MQDSLYKVWKECWAVIEHGGVVLWAILAVGVLLYAMLCATWMVLVQQQRRIKQESIADVVSENRREIVRDFAVFELDQLAWLDRRMPVIGVMIGVCTLGGLLGTVSGMLVTFSGLASQAAIDPIEKISVGISEAMITTQAGLLFAIPAALIFAIIRSQVQAVHQLLERQLHSTLANHYSKEKMA
ncbi:tol-Pal system protein TolQ [Rubritalea halochordaticola]|uniref:Tol-Pal system protein TolQ n=1 Tax=Rubritalea halochordaticola TaxID=714537 RepID=A0ABP9UXE9_9BACT